MSAIEKQVQTIQDSACEKNDCCSTAADGSAICMVPQISLQATSEVASCGCNSGSTACSCSSTDALQIDKVQVVDVSPLKSKRTLRNQIAECGNMLKKFRGGVMFAIACLASPCCTPLIVPLVLALLAGTPVAVWMGSHLGWVYGGLTVLSVISFVLAFRWMTKKDNRRSASSNNQSFSPSSKGDIRSQSL